MFTFSSASAGDFVVQSRSDPRLVFHLAAAFDTGRARPEFTNQVVQLAKFQFQS